MRRKRFVSMASALLALSLLVSPKAYSLEGRENPTSKKTVQVWGMDLAYEVMGEGKPVVMLHGWGVDKNTMKGCMEPVLQGLEGWRRIYFDLPGMGDTQPLDRIKNSDDLLAFVIEFINRILPNERFLVVGESYGGYLAQGLIHKIPERMDGMLLICPGVVLDNAKRKIPSKIEFEKDNDLLEELEPGERMYLELFLAVQNRKNWDRFKKEMYSGMQKGNAEFMSRIRSGSGYWFSFDVTEPPQKFDKPTLILAGRQDYIVGFKDLWKIVDLYPRATFVVLDRAGHALQIEQEGLFEALVKEWLERVELG